MFDIKSNREHGKQRAQRPMNSRHRSGSFSLEEHKNHQVQKTHDRSNKQHDDFLPTTLLMNISNDSPNKCSLCAGVLFVMIDWKDSKQDCVMTFCFCDKKL